MRKLHLDLDPRYCWARKNWADGWYAALHKRVLSKLTSLEVLHLDIRDNQYGPRNSNIIGQPVHRWWPNEAMDELVELRFLPLKHVTVTCVDTSKCGRWPHHSKIDFSEGLAMAEAIRNQLLDYQGKEAQLRVEEQRAAKLERQERLQRQQQLVEEQHQTEDREVRDLVNRLGVWVRQCPLCFVRQCQGWVVDTRHPLVECPDEVRDLVIEEVEELHSIRLSQFGRCCGCGLAQDICARREEVGSRCFQEVDDGVCRYQGIVQSVVAAIMTAGPLEVVEEKIYARMKAQGIWGEDERLDIEEIQQVKQGMLRWFGQIVDWWPIEASVLLQAFYWLTVGLQEWRGMS